MQLIESFLSLIKKSKINCLGEYPSLWPVMLFVFYLNTSLPPPTLLFLEQWKAAVDPSGTGGTAAAVTGGELTHHETKS